MTDFSVDVSLAESEVETLSFTYEELVEAIEDWLRKNEELEDDEYVLSMDLPVPVQDDGLIDIDVEVGTYNFNVRE